MIYNDISHIIIITNDAEKVGYEIFKERIKKNLWPIYYKTKLSGFLREGIEVLFYIAGDNELAQSFVASATIESIVEDKDIITDPNKKFARVLYHLKFKNIKIFKEKIEIKKHLDNLKFIKAENKRYFGLYLQGGVKKIDKDTFDYILSQTK